MRPTIRILWQAANVGGVAMSGLEQSQNALSLAGRAKKSINVLRKIMKDIPAKCVSTAAHVRGANIGRFVKVADALLAYGIMK